MIDAQRISAPRSNGESIVGEIVKYLKDRGLDLTDFEIVDGAMHAVWPELYNRDKVAALIVTINVYIEIARQEGFEVKPAYLLEAKMEGLI